MTYIKLFLNKNWGYILAALGVFILIFLGNQDNRLIQSILKKSEKANERNNKLISDLNKVKKTERKQKEDSAQKHQKEINEINLNKNKKLDILNNSTIKEVQDKLKDGPLSDEELEQLADKFRNKHGFK